MLDRPADGTSENRGPFLGTLHCEEGLTGNLMSALYVARCLKQKLRFQTIRHLRSCLGSSYRYQEFAKVVTHAVDNTSDLKWLKFCR